eukprot:6179534-Pleurochrysis_carterae.AAC.6
MAPVHSPAGSAIVRARSQHYGVNFSVVYVARYVSLAEFVDPSPAGLDYTLIFSFTSWSPLRGEAQLPRPGPVGVFAPASELATRLCTKYDVK